MKSFKESLEETPFPYRNSYTLGCIRGIFDSYKIGAYKAKEALERIEECLYPDQKRGK